MILPGMALSRLAETSQSGEQEQAGGEGGAASGVQTGASAETAGTSLESGPGAGGPDAGVHRGSLSRAGYEMGALAEELGGELGEVDDVLAAALGDGPESGAAAGAESEIGAAGAETGAEQDPKRQDPRREAALLKRIAGQEKEITELREKVDSLLGANAELQGQVRALAETNATLTQNMEKLLGRLDTLTRERVAEEAGESGEAGGREAGRREVLGREEGSDRGEAVAREREARREPVTPENALFSRAEMLARARAQEARRRGHGSIPRAHTRREVRGGGDTSYQTGGGFPAGDEGYEAIVVERVPEVRREGLSFDEKRTLLNAKLDELHTRTGVRQDEIFNERIRDEEALAARVDARTNRSLAAINGYSTTGAVIGGYDRLKNDVSRELSGSERLLERYFDQVERTDQQYLRESAAYERELARLDFQEEMMMTGASERDVQARYNRRLEAIERRRETRERELAINLRDARREENRARENRERLALNELRSQKDAALRDRREAEQQGINRRRQSERERNGQVRRITDVMREGTRTAERLPRIIRDFKNL